jgi:hypothetical protein
MLSFSAAEHPQQNIRNNKKWPHDWGHVSRGYELVGNVRKGD